MSADDPVTMAAPTEPVSGAAPPEPPARSGGAPGALLGDDELVNSLAIRTPIEEFEAYVRSRVETLARLGEAPRAEMLLAALELGRVLIRDASENASPAQPSQGGGEPGRADTPPPAAALPATGAS